MTSQLLKAVTKLSRRLKMSESVVKRIMKFNPRPDNIGSFKFFVLHWLVKKSCRIISDGTELKKVPGNFVNENTYSLRFKSKNLKLRFAIAADDISAVLIYPSNSIAKAISVNVEDLPDIATITLPDIEMREEIARQFNEIIFSIETEFYQPILHYLHKDKEPRSTPRTLSRVNSRLRLIR